MTHKAEDYFSLVHYILKYTLHMTPAFQDYEDCFQVGCIGVIKSIEKFDESLGFEFSTYASSRIIGEVKAFLRDNNPVKESRLAAALYRKLKRNDELQCTPIEIAQKYGCSEKLAKLSLLHKYEVLSGDAVIPTSEKPTTFFDLISHDEDNSEIYVKNYLDRLNDRERLIVEMSMNGYSQREIGELVGVSQVQVSRIIKRIATRDENLLKVV